MVGLWNDDWCTRLHPAACQTIRCPVETGCIFDYENCPVGFTDLFPKMPDMQHGNCISLLTESTWNDGHSLCAGLGARMVRIENQTVTDTLSLFIQDRAVEDPPNPVWVGYKRQMVYNHWPLSYHWVDRDSTEPGFIKWSIDPATGKIPINIPYHDKGTDVYKDCATILAKEKAWDAHYCTEYYRPICQAKRCFSIADCQLPVTRAHTMFWTPTQPPPTDAHPHASRTTEPTTSVLSSFRSNTSIRTIVLFIPVLWFWLYYL